MAERKGRLDGRVAIVTGAATGIGEAIAHKFALGGAGVVANGLPDDPVRDVVLAITTAYGDGIAVAHAGDVRVEGAARACVALAVDTFGRLDVLVNNEDVLPFTGEAQDDDTDAFDRTLRMNARTAFPMTKHAVPHPQTSRGVVLAAGSEAGTTCVGLDAAYGAPGRSSTASSAAWRTSRPSTACARTSWRGAPSTPPGRTGSRAR